MPGALAIEAIEAGSGGGAAVVAGGVCCCEQDSTANAATNPHGRFLFITVPLIMKI
jgi:hypothetical protein